VNDREFTVHFEVNYYANGWLITETGEYDIVIEYTPQRLFRLGAAFSLAVLATCICFLSKDPLLKLLARPARRAAFTRGARA